MRSARVAREPEPRPAPPRPALPRPALPPHRTAGQELPDGTSERCSVAELKAACKGWGLPVTGSKQVLWRRLLDQVGGRVGGWVGAGRWTGGVGWGSEAGQRCVALCAARCAALPLPGRCHQPPARLQRSPPPAPPRPTRWRTARRGRTATRPATAWCRPPRGRSSRATVSGASASPSARWGGWGLGAAPRGSVGRAVARRWPRGRSRAGGRQRRAGAAHPPAALPACRPPTAPRRHLTSLLPPLKRHQDVGARPHHVHPAGQL